MDDLGVPLFLETPIYINGWIQLVISQAFFDLVIFIRLFFRVPGTDVFARGLETAQAVTPLFNMFLLFGVSCHWGGVGGGEAC